MREKSTINDCEAGHADLDSMGKDDIISCEISGVQTRKQFIRDRWWGLNN